MSPKSNMHARSIVGRSALIIAAIGNVTLYALLVTGGDDQRLPPNRSVSIIRSGRFVVIWHISPIPFRYSPFITGSIVGVYTGHTSGFAGLIHYTSSVPSTGAEAGKDHFSAVGVHRNWFLVCGIVLLMMSTFTLRRKRAGPGFPIVHPDARNGERES